MTSAFKKYATFAQDFLQGEHNFDGDQFRIALTNRAPDQLLDKSYSQIAEIVAQGGYPAGGLATPASTALVGMETVVHADPVVFVGTGAGFGPFQYAVLYNYSKPNKGLVCFWPYPASIMLFDTETLTVAIPPTTGAFKVV